MMQLRFIIINTLIALFFSSCKTTPELTEEEIYNIINEIIADDSLHIDKVCWKFKNLDLTEDYKKEFSQKDILFIERQNRQFKNLKFKPNKLKWYKKRSKAFEYTIVDTVCNQGTLYHISFPLVSADKLKVMIEFQEDCNCLLGGHGGIDLYEKQNGHWVRTKGFEHWISNKRRWYYKKQLLVTSAWQNGGPSAF